MNIDDILQKVAEKNGVSVEEVKEEMEKAISGVAKNPSSSFKEAFGDKEPDIEEFLKTVASKTLKRTAN